MLCGRPPRDFLHLRDAYRDREGGAFQLQQFHNELLSYGGLPVSLIRWGMGLGLMSEEGIEGLRIEGFEIERCVWSSRLRHE